MDTLRYIPGTSRQEKVLHWHLGALFHSLPFLQNVFSMGQEEKQMVGGAPGALLRLYSVAQNLDYFHANSQTLRAPSMHLFTFSFHLQCITHCQDPPSPSPMVLVRSSACPSPPLQAANHSTAAQRGIPAQPPCPYIYIKHSFFVCKRGSDHMLPGYYKRDWWLKNKGWEALP